MPIGYGQFSYKKRNRPAHVWSYIAFKGPVPDGLEVCHECDVRDCCNPTHLWLGTHSQNMLDAVAKNRMTPYPLDLKMRIIRARGKNGDIARRFGVKTHLVRRWRLPKVKETIRRAWRERQRLI